jgi:hypothetical protein
MMDDIDRDIQRAQIGKREEPLVNPYKPKEKSTSKYVLPPMNVNYHKYKHLKACSYNQPIRTSSQSDRTEASERSTSGLWFVGLAIFFGIGTKMIGLW